MVVLAIGVLVWEALLVSVSYWILQKKIRLVRAEFEKATLETLQKEEAAATALINAVEIRLKAVEGWIDEEEAAVKEEEEARHADMVARGEEGIQSRRDKQELAKLAYEEGSAIIRSAGDAAEKQEKLLQLLQAYPDVALTVGKRLNRAFRLSDSFGISEEQLLRIVAQQAAQALQQNRQLASKTPDGY